MGRRLFYVWYDIEAELWAHSDEWPVSWVDVDVTTDQLMITVSKEPGPEVETETWQFLKSIFNERADSERSCLLLEAVPDQERLMWVMLDFAPGTERRFRSPKPLFASKATSPAVAVEKPSGAPPILAFYSYKGGVGRTLSLLSTARVLVGKQPESKKAPTLLIIDADYEAPGLTLLARSQGGFTDFSQLDALALVHATDDWRTEALPLIIRKVKEERLRFPVGGRMTEHFFVPAFRYERQLLSLPVQPSDLLQMRGRSWIVADMLFALGESLGVDVVLVDLRAGISELSAPLLLDPRVERILVSSTSDQSVQGTELILQQLSQRLPAKCNNPIVLLSMVPTDLNRDVVSKIQERFQTAYGMGEPDEQNVVDLMQRLSITELPFSGSLVHLGDLGDIDTKLSGTEMEAALSKLIADTVQEPRAEEKAKKATNRSEALRQLQNLCSQMVYAEKGEAQTFLQTLPLRAFAQKYQTNLPATVIMGNKGAGKTFTYLQLLRSESWDAFTARVLNDPVPSVSRSHWLFPLLSATNLAEQAKETVRSATAAVLNHLNKESALPESVGDAAQHARQTGADGDPYWRDFWLQQMALSLGLKVPGSEALSAIQALLEKKNTSLTFVVDGLEDHFMNAHDNKVEQAAIRALCQGVISRLQDLPRRRLGLVVFIRRDIATAAIPQNFGQFAALYEPYELRWSPDEALRLVLWIAGEAGVPFVGNNVNLNHLSDIGRQAVESALLPLWGLKMGPQNSREAYTASWVLAALSDLHGRLQARDVVRFLRFAARYTEEVREKDPAFRTDRLLQVPAIKRAIGPCGEEKIKEIGEEIPALKRVFERILIADPEMRKMPFQRENFDLSSDEVRLLKDQGVVFEDEKDGFYTSEIYRQGLQLKTETGARPKVVVLLRSALSSRLP